MTFSDNKIFVNLLIRYLAGDSSLKETRNVSRKQLSLFSSGVGFSNEKVRHQTILNIKFQKAINIFIEQGININSLCSANATFLGIEPKKAIRNVACNVSNSKGECLYIAPEPEQLMPLLQSFSTDINQADISLEKAILFYSRLINIHPFFDANGRTARAMVCAMLKSQPSKMLSFLFRLNANQNDYGIALRKYQVTSKQYIECDYWKSASHWTVLKNAQCLELIKVDNNKLTAPFLFFNGAELFIQIIGYLWFQPILFLPKISKELDIPLNKLENAISQLCKNNILKPRAMRFPKGSVVFECPQILSTYEQIDKLLSTIDKEVK